jgi:hypothetical protein
LIHPTWRWSDHFIETFEDKTKITYFGIPVITESGQTVWFGQECSITLYENENKRAMAVRFRIITEKYL